MVIGQGGGIDIGQEFRTAASVSHVRREGVFREIPLLTLNAIPFCKVIHTVCWILPAVAMTIVLLARKYEPTDYG